MHHKKRYLKYFRNERRYKMNIKHIDKLENLIDELRAIGFIIGDLGSNYYQKDVETVTYFLQEEILKRTDELKEIADLIKH